jgi:cytochrome P450 PksS
MAAIVPLFGAPSVCLPENVIPSADAGAPLSRVRQSSRSFCLRVSGAVAPSASKTDLSRDDHYVFTKSSIFGPLSEVDFRYQNQATFPGAAAKYRQNRAPMQPKARAMTMRVDFTSQAFFRDPAAGIEKLRACGPVVETRFPIVGKVWITTTYEATARVLKDSATFTLRKEGGGLAGLRWWMPAFVSSLANNMLTTDEPDHTRLRGIVDEAFRRRAILDMEPRIRAIADDLANQLFADGSPADLVERYARMLPLSVICELLGLPRSDRPRFITWANRVARLTNVISFLRMIRGLAQMKHYLEERLRFARAQGGEGLIADLVRVEMEGGRISANEMVSMIFLLLGAGSETTTHLISGSVYELLKNPTLRDWLEEDWSRAGLAVEEFLRFVSPVQFSKPRFVRQDIELGGVRLKKGDRIMAMVAAANMDPQANEHPERLDLQRRPNRHISFGTGIHFCLGHQLARIEGMCALQALLTRWPRLCLAMAPAHIRWRERPGLRSIEQLPVVPGP